MTITANEFERLGTVSGFNNAVLHCKSLIGMLGDFDNLLNLADIVNREVASGNLTINQVNPIITALMKDKYHYAYLSYNLVQNFSDFSLLTETVAKWKALDLVLVYHHPELGILAINPKNPKSFEGINLFKKDEILILYAGAFGNTVDEKLAADAIQNIISLFNGKKIKQISALEKGKYGFSPPKEPKPEKAPVVKQKAAPVKQTGKKTSVVVEDEKHEQQKAGASKAEAVRSAAPTPSPAPPSSTGRRTMTPMYSVPVTNELFHNGNVEAWKKIITSYTTKYPGSEVYIFYEGERIHDINTLFKWGKVKHGSSILFAIAGDDIKDVAKLQRYLRQGASSRFEDFLRFPVNSVLKLF